MKTKSEPVYSMHENSREHVEHVEFRKQCSIYSFGYKFMILHLNT